MPDQPLPSSVPIPPPAPTPAPQDEAEESDELAKLSPFVVLQKKNQNGMASLPLPLVQNVPPPAPAPELNRDELLKQASESSADTFILPGGPMAAAPVTEPGLGEAPSGPVMPRQPESASKPGFSMPLPAPTPSFKAAETESTFAGGPVAVRRPVTSQPPLPGSAPRQSFSASPTAPQVQMNFDPTRRAEIPQSVKRAGGVSAVIAVFGVLLVLVIIAGTAYSLALTGIRIPFVYSAVSGLKTTGKDVAAQALTQTNSYSHYQQGGTVQLKRTSDATTKPLLPGSGTPTVKDVASITTLISTQVTSQVDTSGNGWISEQKLQVDNNVEVPLVTQVKSDSPTNWTAYLPANTADKLVAIPGSSLKQTLLFPVLDPTVLTVMLSSAQKEQAYVKKAQGSKNIAAYTYTFDPLKMSAILPDTATFSGVSGEIDYYWNTKVPAKANLHGNFTYNGVLYQYIGDWTFDGWDAELVAPGGSNLSGILSPGVTTPLSVSVLKFENQLGILTGSLPTTGTDVVPTDPNLPVPPLTPSGEVTTSVGDPILVQPPLPSSTVTTQMKSRDVQRKNDLADLKTALDRYKAKQGSYPVVKGFDQTRSSKILLDALVPTYMKALPIDSLKETYWYEYSSDGLTFRLRSVAENAQDPDAKKGASFYYFEVTNK
jgi:hypothetical protein